MKRIQEKRSFYLLFSELKNIDSFPNFKSLKLNLFKEQQFSLIFKNFVSPILSHLHVTKSTIRTESKNYKKKPNHVPARTPILTLRKIIARAAYTRKPALCHLQAGRIVEPGETRKYMHIGSPAHPLASFTNSCCCWCNR